MDYLFTKDDVGPWGSAIELVDYLEENTAYAHETSSYDSNDELRAALLEGDDYGATEAVLEALKANTYPLYDWSVEEKGTFVLKASPLAQSKIRDRETATPQQRADEIGRFFERKYEGNDAEIHDVIMTVLQARLPLDEEASMALGNLIDFPRLAGFADRARNRAIRQLLDDAKADFEEGV